MLGALPTQDTLILERFFDESGGMQLVLHAPFGSRVNRAWGLALRKRFCRQFNFELQAAATEDAVLLSLGPQHSFPLESVFRYLHPDTVRDVLVQALLDAPMFGTHWRWNASIALALPRSRGGRKVPPQIQRMEAEDLLAAVFPDAAACLENIPGDREVPDHPLVRQTVDDCLHEVMDIDGLIAVLRRIHAGEIRLIARDLPEPSPLAHEILNARPYQFLDDAPLEERRAQAVYTRRAFEPSSADDLGALDPAAIERVREEVWPEVRDADELHDALLTSGFLTEAEASEWAGYMNELVEAGRAARVEGLWVAAERRAEVELPDVRELVRGRLGIVGPTTAAALAATMGVPEIEVEAALVALESEGVVLRGRFSPRDADAPAELEWCERRLLARIHRYTLNRLRAEIEPVSPADFMRFLFAWQRVDPEHRAAGLEGLASVVEQLDGFEVPAAAWESDVLAARVEEYDPALLDTLSLTGRVGWAAGRRGGGTAPPIRSTPIALFAREHAGNRPWPRADGALHLRRAGSRGAGAPRRLILPRAGPAVRPPPHPGGAGARRAGGAGPGHVGQLRRASSADHAFEQAQAARRRPATPPHRTLRHRERRPMVAGGPNRGGAGRARRAIAAPPLRRGVQAGAGQGGRCPTVA